MKRWWPMALLALLLAACSQAASPLPLHAPWSEEAEETTYVIARAADGKEVGRATFIVRREGDAYVLDQRFTLGVMDDHIVARVRAEDLKPLGGTREVIGTTNDFTLTTTYEGNKLAIKAKTKDGDKAATITVPADAYDNDTLLMILRGLPWAAGWEGRFTNVVAANALQVKIGLKVVGQETWETPQGHVETWHLRMTIGQQHQDMWYDVEPPHLLRKYDNGTTVFTLAP